MRLYEAMRGAHAVHGVLLAIAAIGFFRFWARTRFWLPRYVHYLAAFALALGLLLVSMAAPDAPINRDPWGGPKKTAMVLVFPALVYFFFVFFGGQAAAYDGIDPDAGPCPGCGDLGPAEDGRCPRCGRSKAPGPPR